MYFAIVGFTDLQRKKSSYKMKMKEKGQFMILLNSTEVVV